MNDELTELENELRSLRPRRLPTGLRERIAAELAAPEVDACPAHFPARSPAAGWLAWALPLAACLALAVFITALPSLRRAADAPVLAEQPPAVAPDADAGPAFTLAPGARLRPVRATNVLYDTADEGVVYLQDRTPARQVRLRYYDTITWSDAEGRSSLQWMLPREEVLLLPLEPN